MRSFHAVVVCAALLLLAVPPAAAQAPAAPPPGVPAHFEPLAPFVGKTWRGEFAESTPEKPAVDVSRWEWALGGQAIRIVHSLNDGEYAGETIIMHDPGQDALVFHYFTNAGFFTVGTFEPNADGSFTAYEEVKGNADGITAVRSTARILPDGRLHNRSEYLKEGAWVPGHEVTYEEAPGAEVILPPLPESR